MNLDLIDIENLLFEKALYNTIENSDEILLDNLLQDAKIKKMRDHICSFIVSENNQKLISKINPNSAWQKVLLQIIH